jgi:hypothetical protein
MGPTLRNTEADSALHQAELAIVTKGIKESEKKSIGSLDQGVPTDFAGPFEWVDEHRLRSVGAGVHNGRGRGNPLRRKRMVFLPLSQSNCPCVFCSYRANGTDDA